jgi:TolA-binding protein
MKKLLIIVCLFSLLLLGCAGNNAEELYKTAEFEELQNNKEHAMQLYSEIIGKYPDSPQAQKAKEKLAKLKEK